MNDIRATIAVLKLMSEPMAHDLLDALGDYMEGQDKLRDDAAKLVALIEDDNTRWSRRVDDLPDNVRRIGVSR